MPDETDEQLDEREEPRREVGSNIAGAGHEAARNAARRAAAQAAKQAAATVARGAVAALAANPIVWAIVAIAILIVGILFLGVALGGSDLATAGTSQTVPFSNSPTDLSALRIALAGGVDSAAKAQVILTEVANLKTRLSGNSEALAILNAIEAAAQAIIEADPSDTATIQQQAKIINQKFGELESLIGTESCGAINPCLDVEPIFERVQSHCGRVSALMVLLYVNKDHGVTYFPADRYIETIPSGKRDASNVENCLSDKTMNDYSPPDRRGWQHKSYKDLGGNEDQQKEKILTTIQNSLNNGDPVVMYFEDGGIFDGSEHIVVVVGYDASDESDKGGTYLINNPNIDRMSGVKTKFGINKRKKLTGDWLKQYMGGDGSPYETSIVVRRQYIND